jgi:hypothetical protein
MRILKSVIFCSGSSPIAGRHPRHQHEERAGSSVPGAAALHRGVPAAAPRGRPAIWSRIFPSQTPTRDMDLGKLSRLNLTGGNIRNIALNAAFLAAAADEPCV